MVCEPTRKRSSGSLMARKFAQNHSCKTQTIHAIAEYMGRRAVLGAEQSEDDTQMPGKTPTIMTSGMGPKKNQKRTTDVLEQQRATSIVCRWLAHPKKKKKKETYLTCGGHERAGAQKR